MYYPINECNSTKCLVRIMSGFNTVEEAFIEGRKLENYDNTSVMVREFATYKDYENWLDNENKFISSKW